MSATNDRGNPPPRGTPAGWVEPELATLTHDRFSDRDWLYERKFDGERCLAISKSGRVSLLTRNRKQAGGTYPELADALAAQDVGDFLVDGEVVAFAGKATSFAKLQRRMHLNIPAEIARLSKSEPVFFIVFWLVIVRSLFWRRRAWYGGGCGPYGPYGRFEEWHRQAHAREGDAPTAGGPGER